MHLGRTTSLPLQNGAVACCSCALLFCWSSFGQSTNNGSLYRVLVAARNHQYLVLQAVWSFQEVWHSPPQYAKIRSDSVFGVGSSSTKQLKVLPIDLLHPIAMSLSILSMYRFLNELPPLQCAFTSILCFAPPPTALRWGKSSFSLAGEGQSQVAKRSQSTLAFVFVLKDCKCQ